MGRADHFRSQSDSWEPSLWWVLEGSPLYCRRPASTRRIFTSCWCCNICNTGWRWRWWRKLSGKCNCSTAWPKQGPSIELVPFPHKNNTPLSRCNSCKWPWPLLTKRVGDRYSLFVLILNFVQEWDFPQRTRSYYPNLGLIKSFLAWLSRSRSNYGSWFN